MIADLQIHSVFSSYPLYLRNSEIMRKLRSKYKDSEFFDRKNLWWVEDVLIDGISTPEQILKTAKSKGLGAVAITDHNTTIGNLEAQLLSKKYGVLVIPAMEVSTLDGEILAYGIKNKIPFRLTAEEAINEIHRQGGVAVAAHPFNPKHKNQDFARIDEEKIMTLDLDGLEVVSPIFGIQDRWRILAKKMGVAMTAGSDAHTPALIGSVWTEFDNNCNTVEKIINAIKNHQTEVGYNSKRFSLFVKTATEYFCGNTLGRPFIKVI